MIQKLQRMAGIFRSNEVYAFERFNCTVSYITKIPDRSSNNKKFCHAYIIE